MNTKKMNKLLAEVNELRKELEGKTVEKVSGPKLGLRIVSMPEKVTIETIQKKAKVISKYKRPTLAKCFIK